MPLTHLHNSFLKKLLTSIFLYVIIGIAKSNIGELCNGSTADSDSVCLGSNPCSPANNKRDTLVVSLLLLSENHNGFSPSFSFVYQTEIGCVSEAKAILLARVAVTKLIFQWEMYPRFQMTLIIEMFYLRLYALYDIINPHNKYRGVQMSDLYLELVKKAKLHKELYHYTKIETLDKILANNSLLINHLSSVNDPEENKRITSIWHNKIFVSCFTHTLSNSDYFYKNYGKVRIVLNNDLLTENVYADSSLKIKLSNFHKDFSSTSSITHKSYEAFDDWCLFDSSFADVYYTNDLEKHKALDNHESNAGLIKLKSGINNLGVPSDWSKEEESRLRIAVRPIGWEYDTASKSYPSPPFSKLFFSIKNKILRIEMCDFCSEKEKIQIETILKRYFK